MSTITIEIRTVLKKSISLTVNKTDKVSKLKKTIQEKEGIEAQFQRLLFAGKELKDDEVLSKHGVYDGSIIQLALGGIRSTKYEIYCTTHSIHESTQYFINTETQRNSNMHQFKFLFKQWQRNLY